jgi:branched-chain amino acid transport system permease protein
VRVRVRLFVRAGAWAGLAGGLLAAHKGAVFPSVASVSTSVDALLAVLLGGMHQWLGAAFGATWLSAMTAELGGFTYWRGLLGLLVMLTMVWAPSGVLGALQRKRVWHA